MKATNSKIEKSAIARQRFQDELETEIFTLFCSNIECDGISGDTLNYVLRKFYVNGEILASLAVGSQVAKVYLDSPEDLNDYLVFCDFSTLEWGYHDLPIKVRNLNPRGISFIDMGELTPNVDCVIGHICKNRITPAIYVRNKIEDIVNILMTIRTNLNSLKMPFLVKLGGTPKFMNARQLMNALLSDEPALFIDGKKDMTALEVLNTGVANHIKELYDQVLAFKNEIFTFLGLDNSGQTFKAEHLNADEVNSNNIITNVYANNFKSGLKEFEDGINEVLGARIHFHTIAEKSNSIHERDKGKEDNEDDNQQ